MDVPCPCSSPSFSKKPKLLRVERRRKGGERGDKVEGGKRNACVTRRRRRREGRKGFREVGCGERRKGASEVGRRARRKTDGERERGGRSVEGGLVEGSGGVEGARGDL